MAWILVRRIPAAAALSMATLLLPSEVRAQPSDLEHCVLNDGRPMPPNLCNMLRKMAEQGAQEFAAREKEGADAAARNEARRLREERQKQEADAAAKKKALDAAEQQRVRALTPEKIYRIDNPPPRGQRHWAWHSYEQYGYPRELSAADRQNGVVTAPLFLVMYRGREGSTYSFVSMSPQMGMSCTEPCAAMKLIGGDIGLQIVPITPGSILWAMVEDARNGWFTSGPSFTNDPNYKPDR